MSNLAYPNLGMGADCRERVLRMASLVGQEYRACAVFAIIDRDGHRRLAGKGGCDRQVYESVMAGDPLLLVWWRELRTYTRNEYGLIDVDVEDARRAAEEFGNEIALDTCADAFLNLMAKDGQKAAWRFAARQGI